MSWSIGRGSVDLRFWTGGKPWGGEARVGLLFARAAPSLLYGSGPDPLVSALLPPSFSCSSGAVLRPLVGTGSSVPLVLFLAAPLAPLVLAALRPSYGFTVNASTP